MNRIYFFAILALTSTSARADRLNLVINVQEHYVLNNQQPNRYDLTACSGSIKLSGKIDGEKFSTVKSFNSQLSGGAMIIGNDEVTIIEKSGKQEIIPAHFADSGKQIEFSQLNPAGSVEGIPGGFVVAKGSKTYCAKQSTSVMTCSLGVKAVEKVH